MAVANLRSMKTKVTIVVTLCFVAMLAIVSATQTYRVKTDMRRVMGEQQFTLVSHVASEIDEKIAATHEALIGAATAIPPALAGRPAELRKYLENRMGLRSMFDGVFFLSPRGITLVDVPRIGGAGVDVSDLEYFQRTVRERKPQISLPLVGRVRNRPLVVLTAPKLDESGRLIGILTGALGLDRANFIGRIGAGGVGKTGSFALLGRDRTIIVSRDRERILTQGPARGVSPYFDRATDGEEGWEEAVNSRGLRALFAYKQLRTLPWVLVAALPVEEAYAPVAAAQRRMIEITLVLAALLAPIVWLGTRYLMQPLLALHESVRRMRTGVEQLELPAAFAGRKDEIGDLAAEFAALLRELAGHRAELERAARHDDLTGLPNRHLFLDRLDHALARARRSGLPVCVFYVDLDHFKSVNDTMGHAVGDELLKQFAARLVGCVRGTDTVARLGGDEFVVLLEETRGPADALALAQKIIELMQEELQLGPERMRATASIGIAFSQPNMTGDALLQRADAALYQAKQAGRNRFHVSSPDPAPARASSG